MSVMLSTTNPEAVRRILDNGPLPDVGDTVLFFPRPSEIRAGRQSVPAVVLRADRDNRRLDLLVIYDADDFKSLRGIAQRIGDDQGWELRPASGVTVERFEAFMAEMAGVLFGEHAKPDSGSMLDAMMDIYSRLKALEGKPRKK